MKKSVAPIYQIKITLRHVTPPVWRRIEVSADIKLGKLHKILQTAMGWTDSHLHAFRAGGVTYGMPNVDPDFPDDTRNERNVRLDQVAQAGDALIYEYDFGDGWEHELKIEKAFAAEPAVHYPRCTAGKHACPPEDCGGPPGYQHLLDALRDASHDEHDGMRAWVGDEFDAEAFDVDAINERLWRAR